MRSFSPSLTISIGVMMTSLAVTPASAEANIGPRATEILTRAYGPEAPGAAAIITQGGKTIWLKASGMADLEKRRVITPDTVFRTASITKQLTAAVILQLVVEKKLSLDDPLSRFFPDWPAPTSSATVRQLLNHSSGVFDFSKIPGFLGSAATKRPNTTADLLAVIRGRPAAAAPGTRWEYNNSGYVLLGAIIEQISGKPWATSITERIARPLHLTSLIDAVSAEGRPATAKFYGKRSGEFVPAEGAHMSVAHAAGGIDMSVRDMAAWANALHHGRVVKPDLYRAMISPAHLSDGSTRPYGFGLRLQRLRGRTTLVHGGAARGVDTSSIYVPKDDVFVAVFANSDVLETDAATVATRLAALAVGQPIAELARKSVAQTDIEPLFGSYAVADGAPLRFFRRNGKLIVGRGNDEHEAFTAGNDRFLLGKNELMWFAFERHPGGEHVMIVDRPDAAQPLRAIRQGSAPAQLVVDPEVLRSYRGTYTTEQPSVVVAQTSSNQLTISLGGREPLEMRPISATEFRVDAAGLRVVFHPEAGQTDRLTIYRGARELHGVRRVD